MGSADWMSRNLDPPLEVIAPVKDKGLCRYLKDVVLAAYLRDNTQARVLPARRLLRALRPAPGEQEFNSHCIRGQHQPRHLNSDLA